MTGLAVKSNGTPRMSAYSTLNNPSLGPSSFSSYDCRRSAPADDLLAEQLRSEGADAEDVRYGVRSQPSVSIETEETQRIFPPNCPYLPTVFMTSRSNS